MAASPTAIVVDGNPDALAWRLSTLRSIAGPGVVGTTSRIGALLLAGAAAPQTPVLVDLCSSDAPSVDRPGERVIALLHRSPAFSHVRPVAWSAHLGVDVVLQAREAGATSFVVAGGDPEAEARSLSAVMAGHTAWPHVVTIDGAWGQWFSAHYGATWADWMEPVLVRLAMSGERKSVAQEIVARGAARSEGNAQARLREVARIVAGTKAGSPPKVAQQASLLLAHLATYRALQERPSSTMSLELAAGALAREPTLGAAAGLTELEIAEVLDLAARVREKRAKEVIGPGAPRADFEQELLRFAAGQRAAELGASPADVDVMIDGVLGRLSTALTALQDALHDARQHPAARAAAALVAASRSANGARTAPPPRRRPRCRRHRPLAWSTAQ